MNQKDARRILESKGGFLYKRFVPTPLGDLIVLANEAELVRVSFLPIVYPIDQIRIEERTTPLLECAALQIQRYFSKELTRFSLPLCLPGTLFQQSVWSVLSEIPYGSKISYQMLAEKIGKPTAWRAVARANALNPFCVVIPCHRVVHKHGESGGYAWGVEKKRWLLSHEA